jgi:hypothetical protein
MKHIIKESQEKCYTGVLAKWPIGVYAYLEGFPQVPDGYLLRTTEDSIGYFLFDPVRLLWEWFSCESQPPTTTAMWKRIV